MQVLITRPIKQAQELAQLLAAANMLSICFPVLDIVAPLNKESLSKAVSEIASADSVIFISPSSVEAFVQAYSSDVFSDQEVLALGGATAKALNAYSIKVAAYPDKANSEALLKLPNLQSITGKKIVIFAGEAGKKTIADTLQQRGAWITTGYTHMRALPRYESVTWDSQNISISVCTSEQSLENFSVIIEQLSLDTLFAKDLLVISPAMIDKARQLGFKSDIILADGASNSQLLVALKDYQHGMSL